MNILSRKVFGNSEKESSHVGTFVQYVYSIIQSLSSCQTSYLILSSVSNQNFTAGGDFFIIRVAEVSFVVYSVGISCEKMCISAEKIVILRGGSPVKIILRGGSPVKRGDPPPPLHTGGSPKSSSHLTQVLYSLWLIDETEVD